MALIVLVFELVCLFALNKFGITNCPDFLITPLILFSAFSVFVQHGSDDDTRKVQDILFLGLIFRILLIYFDLYGRDIMILPNSGGDSEMFYSNAVNVSRGGTTRRGFFPQLMGIIFRYIGTSRLWGQYLLVLCSMVSLTYAVKALTLLKLDDQIIRKTMFLLALLPNYAILSSIFLRESIVSMLISIASYNYIQWIVKKREKYFLFSIAFVMLAMLFHSGTIAVAVGFALSRFFYNVKTEEIRITTMNIIGGLVILLIGVFVLNQYGDSLLGTFGDVDSVEDIAKKTVEGGSSYSAYVGNSNSIQNFIIYSFPRMIFFQFSPMPWMIRGISDIIAFCFSSCFYLTTLVSCFKGLRRRCIKNREIVVILIIVVFCSAFVFGWGVTNSGTACRHRDKMIILWGLLYALSRSHVEYVEDPVTE